MRASTIVCPCVCVCLLSSPIDPDLNCFPFFLLLPRLSPPSIFNCFVEFWMLIGSANGQRRETSKSLLTLACPHFLCAFFIMCCPSIVAEHGFSCSARCYRFTFSLRCQWSIWMAKKKKNENFPTFDLTFSRVTSRKLNKRKRSRESNRNVILRMDECKREMKKKKVVEQKSRGAEMPNRHSFVQVDITIGQNRKFNGVKKNF